MNDASASALGSVPIFAGLNDDGLARVAAVANEFTEY